MSDQHDDPSNLLKETLRNIVVDVVAAAGRFNVRVYNGFGALLPGEPVVVKVEDSALAVAINGGIGTLYNQTGILDTPGIGGNCVRGLFATSAAGTLQISGETKKNFTVECGGQVVRGTML